MASLALELTRQEWTKLSLNASDSMTAATAEIEVLVERVTALLLVRIVACVAPPGMFPDLSTTMICMTSIGRKRTSWPSQITLEVIHQLRVYVTRILAGYKDVPYHNREHAYHVILSVNKLLDMMTCCYSKLDESTAVPRKFRPPPSFGLRNEPLAMFALVFAALIHDVEHQGIPNRQLASENDRLAVLYNDQSIAENWSLYVAFSELLQDEFVDLRKILFGTDLESPAHRERYLNFRKMVVSMVLSTDIASPERTQVGKSKWKEAFGDPHETVEAKLLMANSHNNNNNGHRMRRLSNYSAQSAASGTDSSLGIVGPNMGGSSSDPTGNDVHSRVVSNSLQGRHVLRRMTQESAISDMTPGRRSSEEGTATSGYYYDPEDEFNQTIGASTTATSLNQNGEDGTPVAFNSLDEVDQDSITPEHSQHGNDDDDAQNIAGNVDELKGNPTVEENEPAASSLTTPSKPIQNHQAPLTSISDHNAASNSMSLSVASDHPRYSGWNSMSLSAASDHPRYSGLDDASRSRSSLNQFLSKSHHRFESRISRASAGANASKQYRQRLGILRTVDLGGETLQTYSKHDRHSTQATVAYSVTDAEVDEPDELKMTVVMETVLAAADVAHNLQSWSHMLSWSKRLYHELRLAYVTGRGVDVSPQWFENQIGFLESYVLPLARRLEDTGVYGDEKILPSIPFAQRVEELRDEWIAKGYEFSQELIQEAAELYPFGATVGSNNSSGSGSVGSGNKTK